MTFLSFYSDHHHSGRGNEALVAAIESRKWNDVEYTARTDPLHVGWKYTCPGFVDGKQSSTILPIHLACLHRPPPETIKVLTRIYKRGLSTPDSAYQRLPLHIACMNGASMETVSTMVSLDKKSVKAKDALGRLAIHYAAKDPRMEQVVLFLLKAQPAAAKSADSQGFLPLHVACRCGMSVRVIRELIRTAPKTTTQPTKKGSTPFMCAKLMKQAHKDEVLGLIHRATDSDGTTNSDMSNESQDETLNILLKGSLVVRR